jgi:hypothetical protein
MKKLILAVSVVLCVLLCSCTQYSKGGYEFDAGVTVDINDLESLFETTLQSAESTPLGDSSTDDPNETTTTPSTQPNIGETETVYWTASGTKYHLYRDCQSLKRSTNVESGTLEESKKAECCKYCLDRASGNK